MQGEAEAGFFRKQGEAVQGEAEAGFFRKPAIAVQGEAAAGFFRKQGEAEVSLVIHFARQLLYPYSPHKLAKCASELVDCYLTPLRALYLLQTSFK